MNFIGSDYYEPIDTFSIIEKPRMVNSLIVIRDKKTKRILYVGKNRSLVAASEFFAHTAFGYDVINSENSETSNWPYLSTTYNEELSIDSIRDDSTAEQINDVDQIGQLNSSTNQNLSIDYTNYKICLFCIGTGGSVKDSGTINATARDLWINSGELIPFKTIVSASDDVAEDSNKMYYGKVSSGTNSYSYYFKKITKVEIQMTDADESKHITKSDFLYKTTVEGSILPKVIVTCSLMIEEGEGKSNSDISLISESEETFSSLSLCFGYYVSKDAANNLNRSEYIGIRPATRINFPQKSLSETSSYQITYKLYF